MNHKDCRYYCDRLIKTNKEGKPVKFDEIPYCRQYKLYRFECPDKCILHIKDYDD